MHKLRHALPVALAAAAALALGVASAGQSRSSEVVSCSSVTSPVDTAGRPIALTGKWNGNDGGTYWIRQIGTCLWWAGSGRGFSNVFFGQVIPQRLAVYGLWSEVPSGSTQSNGTLALRIDSASHLSRLSGTGGFGGSGWTRVG